MNAESHFSLREVIKSAWHNIKGAKWAIWGAQLTVLLIYIGLGALLLLVSTLFGELPHAGMPTPIGFFVGIAIFEIVIIFLVTPLVAGAQMVALKKMRGESVKASMAFQYWNKWLPLGFTVIIFAIGNLILNRIMQALVAVSANIVVLSAIFGILLIIALLLYVAFFMFNVLLVADKDKGPWQALGTSAKIVAPHWFRVVLLILWIGVVAIIIALPTVLGMLCPVGWVKVLGVIVSIFLLIWAIPYWNLLIAGTYHKLSGK